MDIPQSLLKTAERHARRLLKSEGYKPLQKPTTIGVLEFNTKKFCGIICFTKCQHKITKVKTEHPCTFYCEKGLFGWKIPERKMEIFLNYKTESKEIKLVGSKIFKRDGETYIEYSGTEEELGKLTTTIGRSFGLEVEKPTPEEPSIPEEHSATDISSKLRELKELHNEGLIDDDEFAIKKKSILGEL